MESGRRAVNHVNSSLWFRADQYGRSFQFEVGGPSCTRLNREREAAGPANQTSQAPPAEDRVNKTIVAAPATAFTVGEIPDPVRADLMRGIEIGRRIPQVGRIGIDYLAVESQP